MTIWEMTFKVEFPTGSGNYHTLDRIAVELSQRLVDIFSTRSRQAIVRYSGVSDPFQKDPQLARLYLFSTNISTVIMGLGWGLLIKQVGLDW